VVNGVTRAKLGYRLVGETSPDDLIKLSIDLVKQARDDLSPVRVATSTGSVHVRTLGRASFKRITKLMHEISQLTAITLFPTVILVALLTLVVLV
jgi:predicted neutral ceramidase superfamily lipid hydrolase